MGRSAPSRLGIVMMTRLAVAACLGVSVVLGGAATSRAGELTPDQHARLFAPTRSVEFAGEKVVIAMKGTDRAGYYKCPYFQVFVNGAGPFTFLYDTGAAYTLVSPRVVAAARPAKVVDRGGRRDVVELRRLRVGGLTLRNVWAIDDDSFGVDGILGFPAFGSANVLIDLKARRLVVSHHHLPLPRTFSLPYQAPFNVPTIPLTIGQRTVQSLIDTGDDAYALEMRTAELAGTRFARPPVPAASVVNGANVQTTRVATLAEPVGLGPLTSVDAVVGINDDLPVGDLGDEVLRQFRVSFDPGRHLVWFQPRFQGRRFQIPGNRSAGFTLSFKGEGRIASVVAGSPADRAGLKPGDALLSIEGRPAASFTPRSWDAMLGSNSDIRIRWLQAGAGRNESLPVTTLR